MYLSTKYFDPNPDMHCISFKITHLKRLVLCIVYRMEIDSTFIKITKGFHKKGPIIFKNGGELSLKQGANHLENTGANCQQGRVVSKSFKCSLNKGGLLNTGPGLLGIPFSSAG